MAKQHHHDDESKKPNGKQPTTPKPAIPNMSLDEPAAEEILDIEEVLDVEEIVEDDIPVVEPEPLEVEEALAEEVVDVSGSAVLAEPEMPVEAAAMEAEPMVSPPASDVDLMKMFDEPPAEPAAHAPPPVVPEPPTSEHEAAPSFAALAEASAPVEPAAPASGVEAGDVLFEAADAEPAPASPSAMFADAPLQAPASEVIAAGDIAHTAPASEVLPTEDVPHEAPASEVVVAPTSGLEPMVSHETVAPAAPASDVFAAEEAVEEATPASEVLAAEESIEEAAPASEVLAAESAVEEAAPASDVLAAEEAIEEAAPASEVLAAEASSATRKAEAVLDDDIAAVESASAAEVIEEATAEEAVLDAEEAVATGSSAVLSDVAATGSSAVKKAASGIGKTAAFDQTIAFGSPSSAAKKADDDILVTEEEVEGTSAASAVDLGEMPGRKGSSAKGIDKVAEALESGVDLDAEEAVEAVEAEEGEDANKLAATVPSVEFDELLDEMGDSAESEIKPIKAKKSATKHDDDVATEFDAEAAEDEAPVSKKKGKKDKKVKSAIKSTGDDIDLGELFGDEEAAEAVEAEEAEAVEAEEAEAAEAFDAEEAEAAEAFDEEEAAPAVDEDAAFFDDDETPKKKKKTKTGKKKSALFADEEAALDLDDDEDFAPKKKKKKSKDKATPAPAPARGGALSRVFAGFMFLILLAVGGGAGAAWYFVPDEVIKVAKESPTYVAPFKEAPKGPERSSLDLAHEKIAAGKFDEVITEFKDTKDNGELALRGEAKWYKLVKGGDILAGGGAEGAPLAYEGALKDATDGKNKPLATMIADHVKAKQDEVKLAGMKNIQTDLADLQLAKKGLDDRLASISGTLKDGKVVEDKDKIDVASLKKTLDDLNTDKKSLADVNKILDDQKYKPGKDGLNEALDKKKEADDAIAAVNKVLVDDAKIKDDGAKGVKEVVKARDTFKKDRDDFYKVMKDALQELIDSKNVVEDADPVKALVGGVQTIRKKAESPLTIPLTQLGMSLGTLGSGSGKMVEKTFDMASTMTELKYFQGREKFIQTPEQKLDNHLALLQDRRRKDAAELNAFRLEADWVRSPASKSDADTKTKALYVQGLILRNQEKFAEAKAAFDEMLKTIPPIPKAGSWHELAHKSHKQLVDPKAYYLDRTAMFRSKGDLNAALGEATLAIKAIPDNGLLFAERAHIRFDMIHGKKDKTPEQAKDIRDDAKSAAEAMNAKQPAESAYIVGLLEEELGNTAEAEKHYREAMKLHPANDDIAGKYRVALGRLLLRERTEGAAPVAPVPPPAPDEEKKKKDDKKDDKMGLRLPAAERTIVLHPWSPMIVGAVLAQGQPFEELEDKETLARLNETLKLAEELIASKNDKIKGQGYLLKGSALSKFGKRTEGLKEYTKGLKMIFPGIETKEMEQLVADHPAFQRPDVSATPNPVMAERHFGEGMHFFWSKQYTEAEIQFSQATKYFDKDARYYYYLGLAQLHQRNKKKRDFAIDNFNEGARIEAKMATTNPDAVREVNASLERIQGELRQYLNSYRYNAKLTEPETKDAKDGK